MTRQPIIVGAGAAGLAVAACLKQGGLDPLVLDKAPRLGGGWRHHYDRLVLHTSRGRSGLPGMAMPAHYPRYPTRAQVIDYLEGYAAKFRIGPRLGAEVTRADRCGRAWAVHLGDEVIETPHLIFATGIAMIPERPPLPGIDGFPGPALHSSDYRNADGFAGKRVLVVGFGNSAGDIAVDLAEGGASVEMSVRGPVNILPKELFGIPITSFGILRKIFPYTVADALTQPVVRMKIGRPSDYGLQDPPKGPLSQIIEEGKIPLIDMGTLAAIKAGHIGVRPGITGIDGGRVTFADGSAQDYDAILLATGYRQDLRPILGALPEALDFDGRPLVSGGPSGLPGLWFCSYHVSPSGQLAQMGIEAQDIADAILRLGG
ncbi:NAD(P)/FAD-dependent oxidoreductase [Loktanella sp. IMCC34160]|uniref:flavin-containing monooxygenase n=1 Tax=Loktanella sp. IMCC34160 TaxID=2510646 RepID=UPI0013EAD660|nr:NAD(P)/FAD-dependent oxidoreductase [Loktanella sp. IMCC34160]